MWMGLKTKPFITRIHRTGILYSKVGHCEHAFIPGQSILDRNASCSKNSNPVKILMNGLCFL